MATVHRAIERGAEGFERIVALKRLLPHLAEDEEFVRAFVREAKLASMLRHVSIVQIYELGRVGPSYFISMEYIPGRDLRVILRQARRVCGPPPIEVALSMLNELLEALDYAHNQRGADGTPLGLVHRDISPSNLLVSHTGHLKVIDFGIAKATISHLMTHTGRVKGKLSYMAPEALSGRLDARSDLFSASVIAHELLTATPLFACKEDLQTIDKLQNMQPPPPSTKNPSCPPELDAIVLRGLAKDPVKRWQSAAEMRAAVMELASGRYRLASKREVCHWVEEAFEMQAPSRRRMPLAAPAARRNGSASGESDDEIMEMVWGPDGPSAQQPVVLDEVPDVSGRISAVVSMPRPGFVGAEPAIDVIVEEEPTNDMQRPPELDHLAAAGAAAAVPRAQTLRSSQSQVLPLQPPAADIFSLSGTPAAMSWPQGAERPSSHPPEWAFATAGTTGRHAFGGTSSTTGPQAPSGVLDLAIADAQRAMGALPGTASPATPRRRAPLLPVLVAAVAVAGAGAAIAWIVTAPRDHAARPSEASPQKVVAAAEPPPPAVRALPEEAAAAAQPRHEAVDPPPADGTAPAAGAEPTAPAATPPATSGRTGAAGSASPAGGDLGRAAERTRGERAGKGEKTNEVTAETEREPRGKRPPKRTRREIAEDRHAAARARDDADVDDGKDEPAERERASDDGAATPPPKAGSSAQRAGSDSAGSKATKATEEDNLEPLPVPVPEPEQAARPRKPIIITPDRAVRESGAIPRLRFPPWEQAPPMVAYKLCIDATGAVSSVTVLSKLSTTVHSAVVDGLRRWRYKPVVQAGQKVSACFATTFKTELK